MACSRVNLTFTFTFICKIKLIVLVVFCGFASWFPTLSEHGMRVSEGNIFTAEGGTDWMMEKINALRCARGGVSGRECSTICGTECV